MKILIIRLSSIGDCVLSSPVLESLRDRYPKAHIAWVVQSKSISLVQGLPGLDEVILWDPKSRDRNLWRALRDTWEGKFDVALDLQGIDKAAPFTFASRAKRRISGTSARFIAKCMSNERVEENELIHAHLFYLQRASLLDIASDAATRYYPKIPLTDSHRQSADQFLRDNGFSSSSKIIGLNLGASETEKQWPPERFAQLANTLLDEDDRYRVVTFGARADRWLLQRFDAEFDRLIKQSRVQRSRVVDAVGKLNLLEVAAIAEKSAVFVSADTGPMHIAAAVGAPLLALFGPTDTRRTAPVHKPGNPPIKVLDARDLAGTWPASMNLHSVTRVLEEVRVLLSRARTNPEGKVLCEKMGNIPRNLSERK